MIMNIPFVVARLTGFDRTYSQTRMGLQSDNRTQWVPPVPRFEAVVRGYILTYVCSTLGNTTTKRIPLRIFVMLHGYPHG